MGLLRMAARTAVVAGTATAVSGRVAHRQNEKYGAQDRPSTTSSRRPQRPRRPARRPERAAREPGEAPRPGRAHGRGVRGRQGQGSGDLGAPPGRALHAAGGGLRRGRRRPLPRRDGRLPRRALDRRRPRRPRRRLRHRAAGRRAGRARLPGRRRRASEEMLARARRLVGPGVELIRDSLPDLGSTAGSTPSSARRRDHLPRARPAPPDFHLALDPAAAGRLAGVRRPHGRDDGPHRRGPSSQAGRTDAASRSRARSTPTRVRRDTRIEITRPRALPSASSTAQYFHRDAGHPGRAGRRRVRGDRGQGRVLRPAGGRSTLSATWIVRRR